MESFDDIRPYCDHEVRPILDRLLQDKQLLSALMHFSCPWLPLFLDRLLRPLVRFLLQRQLSGISDIRGLQHIVASYIAQCVTKTTDGVVWEGLDELKDGQPYLFLSNHRNIVMDSAFVNYGLYARGMNTMRVAIGDNLLRRSYVSDLMRLNKSFIVQRSLNSRREKLVAYQKLSAFINHSIESGHSVWMAHREGRAKDGNDRTDSAIIKMLHMTQKKQGHSFGEVIARLRIVPVAISYEYDTCDLRKANELKVRSQQGSYEKTVDEDVQSVARGIKGWKGKIHISFGKPLGSAFESATDVVKEVDRQIHSIYHLQSSNYIAYDLLCRQQMREGISGWENGFDAVDLAEKKRVFHERMNACQPDSREWFLKMYANPVINYLDMSV